MQNADPDVRVDLETFLSQVVPEVPMRTFSLRDMLQTSPTKKRNSIDLEPTPVYVARAAHCPFMRIHTYSCLLERAVMPNYVCLRPFSVTLHFQGPKAPWIHTDEGDDDMPGHVKCSMLGASLNVPITKGRLNLGTWQVMMHVHL